MSTCYSWEDIRQLRATLLGVLGVPVPERLCGGHVYLGRYIKCSTFTFTFTNYLDFELLLSLHKVQTNSTAARR